MPQNEHIDIFRRSYGQQMNYSDRQRKKSRRTSHKEAKYAQKAIGIRGKIYAKNRLSLKTNANISIKAIQEHKTKASENLTYKDAIPTYLLERDHALTGKSLSNLFKQKRYNKRSNWNVPIEKTKSITDDVFMDEGKGRNCKKKSNKVVTKVTFTGISIRKIPKYEKFIRPSGLRMSKANVTHPELMITFQLEIIKVNNNPSGNLYTKLGIITRGTIIEVNVSELGLLTISGKIICCKFAQVTNNPENDGNINAVLLI